MNRSIVCGIDGSQVSHRAARVAGELAIQLDLDLLLVHVADKPSTFRYRARDEQRRITAQRATRMLQRVAATLPGIAAGTRVAFGEPADVLISIGREQGAELLIVGSRGRGALAGALLGSVSTRVAAAASCPVTVVPSVQAADVFLARTPGSPVLCGFDDSIGSIRALRLASALAERVHLTLLTVHVDANGSSQDPPLAMGAPRVCIDSGEPVDRLRQRAVETDASAIVVGSRRRGRLAPPLGSVSAALAATAPVPVVILPPAARLPRLAEDVANGTVTDALKRARYWTRRRTQPVVLNGHRTPRIGVESASVGRFSQGVEQLPETPSKLREGRFSDGIEDLPASPGKLRRGRFSEGIEQLPENAVTRRRGSFADGYRDLRRELPLSCSPRARS